jgi:hypothetical protein
VVVDTADVKAKFVKATSSLRVTLRVICEHAGWDTETQAQSSPSQTPGRDAARNNAAASADTANFMQSLQAINGLG